ncbi:MAG: tetratricopeptide repeat protein, partial [Campylobacterota bacterium]|nr:tetratricopeptide repeat protein [Campylobacterota bacterium]
MALTPKEITRQMREAKKALNKKEYNQAVATLDSIIKADPNYAPAYREIASILLGSNTPQNALPYLNKALELTPEDIQSWRLAAYHYKKHQSWVPALKAFEKMLSLQEDDEQILYEIFNIHTKLGSQTSALATIERLTKIDSKNNIYREEYAKFLNSMGKIKEALAEYDKIIYSDRGDISYSSLSEWFKLMITLGQAQGAHKRIKVLSKLNPKDAFIKTQYARSYEALFDFKKALKIFLEAHQLDPKNVGINYNLGVIYEQEGDTERSLKHYKIALSMDPMHISSLRGIGIEEKYTYESDIFKKLNFALAHIADLSLDYRAQLHYAAAKAFEDLGELAIAFEHYKLGGEIHA